MCVCAPLRVLLRLLLWYKGSAILCGSQAVTLWSPTLSTSIIWALPAWRIYVCVCFFLYLFWGQRAAWVSSVLFRISALCGTETVSKERCDNTAGGSIWTLAPWLSTLSQQHVPESCSMCRFLSLHFLTLLCILSYPKPGLFRNFLF